MYDWYEWVKDIGLPLLTGGGSVVVGVGAIYVARRSHKLAEQVRADEAKRDADAARERYRDHLFQTVEPAVTAVLEHRGSLWMSRHLDGPEDRVVGGTTITRIALVHAVADESDLAAVQALNKAFIDANKTGDVRIVLDVLGEMALTLPELLAEPRAIETIVNRAEQMVPRAKALAQASAGDTEAVT